MNVTNAFLQVNLYNSASQPANLVFQAIQLNNDIENYSAQAQWTTLTNTSSIGSAGYHDELSINVTNRVNSASPSGQIIFGIRAANISQMYDAVQSCVLSYEGTNTCNCYF